MFVSARGYGEAAQTAAGAPAGLNHLIRALARGRCRRSAGCRLRTGRAGQTLCSSRGRLVTRARASASCCPRHTELCRRRPIRVRVAKPTPHCRRVVPLLSPPSTRYTACSYLCYDTCLRDGHRKSTEHHSPHTLMASYVWSCASVRVFYCPYASKDPRNRPTRRAHARP